jgi:D-sedoheptulose 7-phosphate isomerase
MSIDQSANDVESRVIQLRTLMNNQSTFDIPAISQLAQDITKVFLNGKKIAFVGNGGSAAEAMHLAAEFTGKCVVNHKPLPALCLNESQSSLTAIANDFGNEHVFSRPVNALLNEGDILVGLSTSGKSVNIINALSVAQQRGVRAILWMGNFESPKAIEEIWKVPSISTPRIQEVHLAWGHFLAEVVERNFQE